jgi:hypothetical protein
MSSQLDAPAIRGERKRGPLEAAHRVVPGFTRTHLAELFRDQGFTRIAEIGVADGRFALTLCETIPNIDYIGVDPWAPYSGNRRGGPAEQHERNYALAQERLKPFKARLIREQSAAAAFQVAARTLDAIYIDGNHAYEYVKTDLQVWSEKVRPCGVIAGHDYYAFGGAGVIEAVNEFTSSRAITDWHLTDEREPSFWWVKR